MSLEAIHSVVVFGLRLAPFCLEIDGKCLICTAIAVLRATFLTACARGKATPL